ncbi:MAG: hypothetical protein ACE5IK_11375 [Acidobacteriota bacterium]
MGSRHRGLVWSAVLCLALAAPPAAAQDNPCIPDPIFPTDCVAQLGPLGEPVSQPVGHGFLNIQAPVVRPLHLLASSNAASGRLYVLNPTADQVRVLDPAAGLAVVEDLDVCARPSALAQSDDGSLLLISCHMSNAVQILSTATSRITGMIQARDADGRPLLQEPMGIAVQGNTAYVASSGNNQVAVIDLASRAITGFIDIPGTEPRALRLTPDGAYLLVANFLAGNRTEPELGFSPTLTNPATAAGAVCGPLLADPSGLAVFDENSPKFMDTSHPDFLTIADCYMLNQILAPTLNVIINPRRPDHDIVVVRTSDNQVVFTTDALAVDIGTMNYDVAVDATGTRVYLATTQARNDLNENFGTRPILNRLAVLDLDPATGVLSLPPGGLVDLDAPFLDPNDVGTSRAATPSAVEVVGARVLVTATGSDALLVLDASGNLTDTVAVDPGPRGVIGRNTTAFVYTVAGMTVDEIDLSPPLPAPLAGPVETTPDGSARATSGSAQQAVTAPVIVQTASTGPSPLPQSERIGGRLFSSAQFASNGTFSCASCHPEGHVDGLVWKLDTLDGLRATMTVPETVETGPYHWDGSKCNYVKILQDGINNLFSNPAGPGDCEMKTMIDWMSTAIRPHSPFRALDDSMSDDARTGLLLMHRGSYRDAQDTQLVCNGRLQDPTAEHTLLAQTLDPFGILFTFNGGGGPFPASVDSETCGTANCHVSPHWESDGFRNGDPAQGLIDGFQAVSSLGTWDRPGIMHDARPYRERYLFALDAYRTVTGAPPVRPTDHMTGEISTAGFNSQFFRHPEYTYDRNPATHAFLLTDTATRFSMEEEELQTSSAGAGVVLDATNNNGASESFLIDQLILAADQAKIVLTGSGQLGASPIDLTWDPLSASFAVTGGGNLTLAQIKNGLTGDDALFFMGRLLPGQGVTVPPKLKAITRTTSPVLCIEAPASYPASVATGETGVAMRLHTIDAVAGTRVLVDGQVQGAPLAGTGPDFLWTLPAAGLTPTVHAIQLLDAAGMQSNSIPLPVIEPVIPASEPAPLEVTLVAPGIAAPTWPSPFGVTGPGTRSDLFRGLVNDLATAGFAAGACLAEDVFVANAADWSVPDAEIPPVGNAFYYVARSENQVNVTTWGSPARDAAINTAAGACAVRFP